MARWRTLTATHEQARRREVGGARRLPSVFRRTASDFFAPFSMPGPYSFLLLPWLQCNSSTESNGVQKETRFQEIIEALEKQTAGEKPLGCEEERLVAMLSDADYSGSASGARRAKRRSSGESPGDSQGLRSSGRQINVRVKRTNNPPPGQSKRKATDAEEEDEQSEKKYRKCEKAAGLQEVASADQGHPAHRLTGSNVSLRDEARQRQERGTRPLLPARGLGELSCHC
ncbi:uncharacterized protein ACNS7B_008443 isoform 1-T1 [Menidia menidia]